VDIAEGPSCFRAGVLKASCRFDQHVEARQLCMHLNASIIIDERIVDNECAARRERLTSFPQQQFLGREIDPGIMRINRF
jgi:hypothetical protein